MGLAILVLPLVALWALFAELQFGLKAQRLSRRLIALDIPGLDLELRASGRATKDSANKELERIQDAVTKDPKNWSLWFQLGEAHDAAGERKNARAAIRQAIQLANDPDPADQ
jgi:cytochrome c-type biogenesis protein CcmH/NrfG